MTDKIIRGSGGPPPTPPSPTRAPDTLNSRQFATIQDLLSEGEIEGFATPSKAGLTKGTTAYNNAALKDIFLNDTSILQSDASNTNPQTSDFNFQNVSFTPRFGTGNQEHIPGIQQSQSPLSNFVSVLCSKSNGGVARDLPTGKDAVKVTVTFSQIQKATDQGDLLGSTVELKISLKVNSETSYTEKLTDTITGRTADAYSKEYRIDLPDGYTFANVKIERVTDDQPSGGNIADAFNVSSIQLLIDDKQTYLNSAYTNLRLDSEQFSSIPKRAFRIRGVKVRIPGAGASNSGTPTVDIQTGRIIYPDGYIFNGTMGAAQWCSCPAMVLLDLLTTERYGFGTHITDSNLDLFSFVAASKYANELVSDGFNGQEARFSCNVNLQGSMEAYTLINELAGVMRCFPIWSEGSVTISQDRPTDPSYLFSLANVGEGGFSYSGSSLKQRHSIISVSYFNMDSREIDYEVVGDNVSGSDALQEDIDRQAKLGIVKKDIKAFACTSRGQARRLGKAVLLSEEQETEVVSFTTSIDAGAIVRPGSVISINDPVRAGERRAGRIKSASTTQITVDNVTDIDTFTGTNKKCSVILPNGTVETKDITSITSGVITLNSALSAAPNANAMWLIQSSTLESQTFRVISVEEQDGINYAITALSYNYNYATGVSPKYAAIDSMQGITLPARNVSLLNEPKDPPANLQASEKIVVINALAVPKIIVSWVSVTGVNQYLVQYRFNNTNWVSENVFRPDFELLNTEAGTYEFKVFSYNAGLKLSATSSNLSFNAVGKSNPPGNVQNLSVEPITNKLVRLRWARAVDPDVLHGGRVYVRHSNLTDGTGTFQNSVDLVSALSGNTTDAIVPFLEGEYILKFQDDQGNFSLGETSIIIDLPDLIDTQTILTQREDLLGTPFSGTKTNTTFDSTASALQLSNPATNSTGEYEFASIVDLEGVFSLDLTRKLQAVGFNIGNDIETLIPSGNFWDDYATDGNFDGPAADEVDCQIQVATSQTASGSFGAFNNFANGNFKGRRFKFKLLLEATNTAQNINVQQAGFTALFQSRTEQNYQTGSGTSIAPQQSGTSSSGKTVTFGTPFFVGTSSLGGANAFLPIVGITIQNAQSGDFFTVTNVSGTQFTVTIKNGSSFVDRSFTFSAVGYGKGV
jgi:predicted phage tail protein